MFFIKSNDEPMEENKYSFDEMGPWPVFNALRNDPSISNDDLYPFRMLPGLRTNDRNAQYAREQYLREKFWDHEFVQNYNRWLQDPYKNRNQHKKLPENQKNSCQNDVEKLLEQAAEKLLIYKASELSLESDSDCEQDAFDERDPFPLFHALRKDSSINVRDLYPEYLMSGFCCFDSNALDSREIYLKEKFKNHKIVKKYNKWLAKIQKVERNKSNDSSFSQDDTAGEADFSS